MRLVFDDSLCEEVTEIEIRERSQKGDSRLSASFRKAADAIYETQPSHRREAAFASLYRRIFAVLKYPDRIQALMGGMDGGDRLPPRCLLSRALRVEEEGAQLSPDGASLGIRICTPTLREPARCAFLIRHEITHILDILDPDFGYEPARPLSGGSPSEENLYRDRYRTLWDLSVDGRLERRRFLPPGMRERRAAEFAALFPTLPDEAAERVLGALWDGPRPSDAALREMVRGAASLCAALGISSDVSDGDDSASGFQAGAPCPLCGFPTFEWAELSGFLDRSIRGEFPDWDPLRGVCTQCANRYLFAAGQGPGPADDRGQDAIQDFPSAFERSMGGANR